MQRGLKVKTLHSLAEFVQHAEQWNRLWGSSGAYEATSRSEAIALWVGNFKATSDFRAVVVESTTGEFLGAIAFIVQSECGLKKLTLTTDEWINCCLLYTSPSPRDGLLSRMPSSA